MLSPEDQNPAIWKKYFAISIFALKKRTKYKQNNGEILGYVKEIKTSISFNYTVDKNRNEEILATSIQSNG